MWRIVYERAPKGGYYKDAGPWHDTEATAHYWLDFLGRYYPGARLQSWQEAYPKAQALR
jgi:hypothetical protein